jgi:1-deoxy-D-xylulose-5-phosphate synthase
MTVMAPKDERELRDMMYTALDHTSGPIAFRYPRGNGVGADLSLPPKKLEIGRAELLREAKPSREKTAALIAFGTTVAFATEAAERLSELGIECDVVNARFAKPLDERLLEQVIGRHPVAVTIEDHVIQGGFGSAVLEFMSDLGLTAGCRLHRMGIDDTFVEHGTQEELYRLCGFDVESIVRKVEQAFYEADRSMGRKVANR